MPVLPLVGSRIVQPGRRVPSFSACWIIASAARSLIEPVGLRSSSFAQRRTSGLGDSVGRPTSGVPPTEARRSSYRMGPGWQFLAQELLRVELVERDHAYSWQRDVEGLHVVLEVVHLEAGRDESGVHELAEADQADLPVAHQALDVGQEVAVVAAEQDVGVVPGEGVEGALDAQVDDLL